MSYYLYDLPRTLVLCHLRPMYLFQAGYPQPLDRSYARGKALRIGRASIQQAT